MRAALFSAVGPDDASVGDLVETAVFAQWFHKPDPLHYARWGNEEVDLVWAVPGQAPGWALEVKWSDRPLEHPGELNALVRFCRENALATATTTTRSLREVRVLGGVEVTFVPAAIYCYVVGYNAVHGRQSPRPFTLEY